MSDSLYKRGIAQAIVAGAFLSTAGIGMRLLDAATPLQVTFYRALGLATFMLVYLSIRSRGHLIRALLDAGTVGVLAGMAFATASWCVIFAFANTTVANVMFIVSLAPCCAAILGWVILRERVSGRTWLAIGIAVCGVLIMVNGGVSAQGVKGMLYAFGMAMAYGLFIVFTRMGKQRDMLPAVFWSGAFLALACAIITDDYAMTGRDLSICLGLGVFQVGLGGVLIVSAAQHVPAAQITFLAMLEVVLSPIWVWLLVDEVPTVNTIIGGVIILAAIGFLALGKRTSTVPHHETIRSDS